MHISMIVKCKVKEDTYVIFYFEVEDLKLVKLASFTEFFILVQITWWLTYMLMYVKGEMKHLFGMAVKLIEF